MIDCVHIVESDGILPPSGPYSPAVCGAGMCFVSCQLATNPASGKLVEGGFDVQAVQTLFNVGAVLSAAGSSWARVVSLTVLLADLSDGERFNHHYREHVASDGPFPARAMYQAGRMTPGALVGVAAVALMETT